jgi:hypothetical protein
MQTTNNQGMTIQTPHVVADFAKLAAAGMASALVFATTASAVVLLLA